MFFFWCFFVMVFTWNFSGDFLFFPFVLSLICFILFCFFAGGCGASFTEII